MNLVSRVIAIIVRPNAAWQAIAMQPPRPASVLAGYVLPLAAIAPIALFLSRSVFGTTIFFIPYHENPVVIAVGSLTSYAVTVGVVLGLAFAVGSLAPSFGGRSSYARALALVGYALTPSYLAGAALVLPSIVAFVGAILALLAGCYAIYLLWTGLPYLMDTSKERAPLYLLAVLGCGLVIGLVCAGVSFGVNASAVALTGGYGGLAGLAAGQSPGAGSAAAAVGGLLGASESDQRHLKDAVDAAASAVPETRADPSASDDPAVAAAAGVNALKALVGANKNVPVVPRESLAALLPASLGDLGRSGGDSRTSSVAGITGTTASADFKGPAGTVSMSLTDLGNASGLAAFTNTAATMAESSDDAGYEKNVELNGVRVHETWRNASKHSEILGIVDSRFSITVDADGVDVATTEAAFSAVDLGKLRDLAASAK